MTKPDLSYVRELLASTEALCQEVAARVAEARRLQDQARALHSQDTHPHPLIDKPCQALGLRLRAGPTAARAGAAEREKQQRPP